MKRLLFLLLFVAALWYGWTHYGDFLRKRPGHEAVVVNSSGREMTRVHLRVDGQTFVKESLADETKVVFPFRVSRDATFQLVWLWAESPVEHSWSGGMVPRGPMLQRHVMTVDGDGAVFYRPENR